MGLIYHTLPKKVWHTPYQINRMAVSKESRQEKMGVIVEEQIVVEAGTIEGPALPKDIKLLKAKTHTLRLKLELQKLIIDISGKRLGIDLRKKHETLLLLERTTQPYIHLSGLFS